MSIEPYNIGPVSEVELSLCSRVDSNLTSPSPTPRAVAAELAFDPPLVGGLGGAPLLFPLEDLLSQF